MPVRSKPALGFAVTLAALVLTGCGSTSTSTAPTAPAATGTATATKAQFVTQAEGICRRLSEQEKPLEARQAALKGGGSSGQAFVALAREVVNYSLAASAKLAALPRPPADAGAIATALKSFSEDIADAHELEQAALKEENDLGEAAESALKRSIASGSKLAGEYGLTRCTGAE